ncbi:LOW QUALITY PROTEIN: glycolipid transfer protein 3-like [Curcuma longa]|uniref:LOW QUALITY PROTEIN: glycolipid transfer protein 3-like n=1 Tax=Curcuma longa TaxID=136217 RepID=UPI003D9EE317
MRLNKVIPMASISGSGSLQSGNLHPLPHLVDLPNSLRLSSPTRRRSDMAGKRQRPRDQPGLDQIVKRMKPERKSKGEEEEEEEESHGRRQGWSDVRTALEELSLFKLEESKVSAMPLLAASNLLLHLLDKIGPTMLVLRLDIQRNVERLEEVFMLDPSLNSSLIEIVKKEVGEGTSRKAGSCSKAILWLTRSIVFGLTLFQKLDKNPKLKLEQVVEEAYSEVLKPWHGWISSAAYKIALKLVPERETLIRLLMGQEQDYEALKQDVKSYVSVIQPLLDEICALLRTYQLDKLKSA